MTHHTYICGDYVEAAENYPGQFTKGKIYRIVMVRPYLGSTVWLDIEADDRGRPNGWGSEHFVPATVSASPTLVISAGQLGQMVSHSHQLQQNPFIGNSPPAVDYDAQISREASASIVLHSDPPAETPEEKKARIWEALKQAAKQ